MKHIIYFSLIILFSYFSCDDPIAPIIFESKVVWTDDVNKPLNLVRPVIENDYTYIATDSIIKCLKLENGELVWETSLGYISGNIGSSKLLDSGNQLFLNNNNWVKSFDKIDGKLIWETIIDNFNPINLSIMSQNNYSLLLGGQGEVIKISKQTGAIELRIKIDELIPVGYTQLAYNPIISEDGFIYVSTGWFDGTKNKGNILCFNSNSGKFVWGFEAPSVVESCAFKDSLIVFPSGSTMISLNRYSGVGVWKNTIENDGFWESVTINDETVYMGSTALAKMYAFDLRTGKLKWISEGTKSSIITIITVQNGRVYFCNFAYIYVLDASTGSVIWKGLPPEYANDKSYRYSSPVAVGEGYMVCIGNKKVYCLTDPQ